MLKANNNPASNKTGRKNHPKIIMAPIIRIKIWNEIPIIIKTNRQSAPRNREKVLETKTFKYSPTLNPEGYIQLYLCHGEKKVLKSRDMEKKFEPKEIKFSQTCNKNFGIS
jgi:hypothetical protein